MHYKGNHSRIQHTVYWKRNHAVKQDMGGRGRGDTGFKAWLKLNSIPHGTSRMWMTHRCRLTGAAAAAAMGSQAGRRVGRGS